MTKQSHIKIETMPHAFILSGDNYPWRISLRAIGAQFDAPTKRWAVTRANEHRLDALVREMRDAGTLVTYDGQAYAADTETPPPVTVTPATTQAPPAYAPAPTIDMETAMRQLIEAARASGTPASTFDAAACQALIEHALAPLREAIAARPSTSITITQGEATRTVDGLHHRLLPELIQALGAGVHCWLAGPSGTGKTHAAEQAAKALGLSFALHGAMTMAFELTGFVDASGRYHDTPFVRAFRDGGLVLLDELDAGSNEALLALNAALANGVMCLPNGENILRHADFRCIGAANTWGAGATADYVGRTRIDAAFLQRFGARFRWDLDEALELAMAGNERWTRRVQNARRRAAESGTKTLITPRASQAGATLIAAGFTAERAAELTYLADLSDAQRALIGG